VLGVDPGSIISGWALLGGTPSRPRVLESGVIPLGKGEPFARRLATLHRAFEELLRELRPASAAVEAPFHGASARAALQLAHARGVILAVLGNAGVEVAEYSPATVKKTVTGNGRAGKAQVDHMVGRLLPDAPDGHRPHDLSDALAIALCHLIHGAHASAIRAGAARSSP
jgi:crossover junction endodeoxyribonuclease RuvC